MGRRGMSKENLLDADQLSITDNSSHGKRLSKTSYGTQRQNLRNNDYGNCEESAYHTKIN